MLWNLATMITNSGALKTIALIGLRMDDHIVETELYYHPGDITSAAHAVLKCWKINKYDPKAAYVELCNALRSVNMGFCVHQALQPPNS